MRSWLLRCWGLYLVVLAGCDGVLEDYSGTRCNANGSCIEGYHCVRETWRCELGPLDERACAISTCFNADGCCPQGCNANNDTDCPSVCGNQQLEPGEKCDDGNTTHEDDCPNTCTPNVCGDGAVDRQEPRVEVCDDGNTVTEQECAYGTRACKQCNASCTGALDLTGRYCGDGLQNGPGEQCDDGNPSNQDNCLDTCVRATCGDGFINTVSVEACDDGNTVNESSCPYGTPNCTRCNATCSASLNLSGPYCGDNLVSNGEACDDGNSVTETACPYGAMSCTRCNDTCSAKVNLSGPYCGDNRVTDAEKCDDGNTLDETSCPYGTRSCTPCNSTCSATLIRTGNFCGDSKVTDSEVCDDGNTVDETSCPYGMSSCTRCNADCSTGLELSGPYCGDSGVSDGEACDDGNTVNETSCPYGTSSCTACNSTCTGTLVLSGNFCGDNKVTHGEVCDDGNTYSETSCPYGTASCTLCNATCEATLALTGPTCGDRIVNGPEVCDDGNTSTCGTCNNTCTAVQLSPAIGTLRLDATATSSVLNDRETFTLFDGINPPVTFEFDKNGSYDLNRVRVNVANVSGLPLSANQVATAIADAIRYNTTFPLELNAVANANVVELTHDFAGSFGNQAITETVASTRFFVSGMAGGRGQDCPEGTGCTTDRDCELGLVCLPAGTCGAP